MNWFRKTKKGESETESRTLAWWVTPGQLLQLLETQRGCAQTPPLIHGFMTSDVIHHGPWHHPQGTTVFLHWHSPAGPATGMYRHAGAHSLDEGCSCSHTHCWVSLHSSTDLDCVRCPGVYYISIMSGLCFRNVDSNENSGLNYPKTSCFYVTKWENYWIISVRGGYVFRPFGRCESSGGKLEKDSGICLCLRETHEPAEKNVRDDLWDRRGSGKENNSGKEKKISKSQTEQLLMRLFLESLFVLHRYSVHSGNTGANGALWAAGISSLLCTHRDTMSSKEPFLGSRQQLLCTCTLACSLMFSRGVFSAKCVLKDELTVTFAE